MPLEAFGVSDKKKLIDLIEPELRMSLWGVPVILCRKGMMCHTHKYSVAYLSKIYMVLCTVE